MAHRPVVQFLEQFRDRRVELGDREEGPVPEPGENPTFDDQHRALNLGLVARLAAAGRQDRGVVMLGHGGKGRVQRRLEPQRLGDPGLQIVADDRPGDAAEEAERLHLAVDPVRQSLAEAGKGEGQVGGAQHCDQDLGGVNDAGRRIDHRHRLPGIVGLHHRASRMPVAEHGARPLPEGGEPVAEPGEAVAVGMGGTIFLPQKRQRHPFALQLPGDPRPIRLAQILRRTAHSVKQTLFQRRIVVKARR